MNKNNSGKRNKIIGGYEIAIEEVPYHAYLSNRFDDYHDVAFCGAALITLQYVLTAKHCIYDVKGNITVVAGTAKPAKPNNEGVERPVKNIYYPLGDEDNDIALIEVCFGYYLFCNRFVSFN